MMLHCDPDFRIAEETTLGCHHEGKDAGQIGLKRQRLKIEHELDMIPIRLGDAGRPDRAGEVRWPLLHRDLDTTFHIPDVYGLGISYRPIPVLTVNVDAVHVAYSNLVDNFVSINASVREVSHPFVANDITELHAGAEYFFSTKIPFAIRGGYWREPAHSLQYNGPLNDPNRVAAAILFPKGQNQNHISAGAGLAWPRFQIDAGYDRSDLYKVGSISAVMRF